MSMNTFVAVVLTTTLSIITLVGLNLYNEQTIAEYKETISTLESINTTLTEQVMSLEDELNER